MENYRDVELTIGKTRVYSPPLTKIDSFLDKDPETKLPEPEIIEEEMKSGKTVIVIKDDDPEYLRKRAAVEALREEKGREMTWLFVLRDVKPPEGWDMEAEMGEGIRYYDPEWQPREGKVAKKLDYIEWVVLVDGANVRAINEALNELAGISKEVVEQIEKSFPGSVEGETA